MVQEITPRIKYIGVTDNDIDLFESQYPVPRGITYNSYLVEGEKTAVIDTVDGDMAGEWKANLTEALAGRTPDYLIIEHMEPDHSSVVAEMLDKYPSMQVVGTTKALQMLPQFFDGIQLDGRTVAVKEGSRLELGGVTLSFITAPMVHWPEVVTVYAEEEKTYFSADAFGTFGQFDDPADRDNWKGEARRYYINICGKYGPQVQSLLKKAGGLDIDYICPLHGPILRRTGDYFGLYDTWSRYEPEEADGILVAYASIYGGTAQAAVVLAERLIADGIENVEIMDLCRCDMSEAVAQAFRMGTLVVAAATYDGSVFPPMHDFLHHLQLKGYRNRRAAIIENGTWAPMAGKLMAGMLSEMKDVTIIEPTVTIRSRMSHSDSPAIDELAANIVAAIKAAR
ncbi:MAG: FprA family A-type flavoprotein [Pseudoflavonifractor sp.]|nr:FprA family A-type flavoprotein [Pseudoflavonifractor sp.]